VSGTLPAEGDPVPHPWPQQVFLLFGKRDRITKITDNPMATAVITN
jgi:hypothetical protein